MRTKNLVAYLACFVVAVGFAHGTAFAQNDENDSELRSNDLEAARLALEEAARELARLSAEAAEPFMRNFIMRVGGFGRRAQLGVSIEDADQGVRVQSVMPGGGADEAGIVRGDIIVAIDGAELVESGDTSPVELLITQMANVEPGETVALRVLRDAEILDLVVEAQPGVGYAFWGRDGGPRFDFRLPDVGALQGLRERAPGLMGLGGVFSGPFRELELVSLTPELGSYFGTEVGLLVVRAPEDEALELRDGDVILDIGGRKPTSPEHAMRILASFEPGESLQLTIMRRQREQRLEFTVPERG